MLCVRSAMAACAAPDRGGVNGHCRQPSASRGTSALSDVELQRHGEIELGTVEIVRRHRKRLRALERRDRLLVERRITRAFHDLARYHVALPVDREGELHHARL